MRNKTIVMGCGLGCFVCKIIRKQVEPPHLLHIRDLIRIKQQGNLDLPLQVPNMFAADELDTHSAALKEAHSAAGGVGKLSDYFFQRVKEKWDGSIISL